MEFLSLLSFEERVLAILRLCLCLLSYFCFLAHVLSHLLFLQREQLLALLLPGILVLRALVASTVKFVSLIERTMYYHGRSLFRLLGCEFRTNFTRDSFFLCKSQYV